jgi:malonyl-CoA/methylmalonyl-CoA synthetase
VLIVKAPVVLLEEAKYLLKLCNCALLATVPSEKQHAKAISDVFGFNLLTYDPPGSYTPSTLTFSLDFESSPIPPEKGFVLLYTSGTTGRPKGVLHSRSSAHAGLKSQVESFGLSGTDTWLHHSPVHWGAGCTLLVASVISRACLELCSTQFSTGWLLTRLQDGDVTCMYLPPSHLDALADKIGGEQRTWIRSQYEAVLSGIRKLRILCSGGVRISPSTQAIWKDLRGGKPLVVVYAMTEFLSLVAITDWRADKIPPEVSRILICGIKVKGK